jgi:hypothetical protein
MTDRYAPNFSPEVQFLFNGSASAISQGMGVTYCATCSQVEDPIPELAGGKRPTLASQSARTCDILRTIKGIQRHTGNLYNHPVGVAMSDIAASAWGYVAVQGAVDVRIGPSQNIAANDYLIVTSTGSFIEDATSVTATTVIHAIALEATITSGTCAAALITAQLTLPSIGAGGKRS